MNISTKVADERVESVAFKDERLIVRIRDGREIAVPLEWFPRPAAATVAQGNSWRLTGAGYGIHWPEVDEDLSVAGLLRGERAPR